LSYAYTTTSSAGGMTQNYSYANGTFAGSAAVALTISTTTGGVTSSSVSYYNPSTGASLGATPDPTAVITFDPPNYQDLINNAFYNIGQIATVAVKARMTGSQITSAFAAIGGGTALTMDYSYRIERKPNESVTVPAGTFANTCKLQIDVTVSNVKLEGNDGSNPLYTSLFGTLSSVFTAPFKNTVWLTSALPNVPKFYAETTGLAAGSATQVLTSYSLAAR